MVEGYVLHSLAWRETSLIVEVFCREEGRMGVVARGARRPRSVWRGLLQPFQPLLLRYSAKGDLRTLMAAEWRGGLPLLKGEALMAGFYLNELLLRLMPRQDPHPDLFAAYEQAMAALSHADGLDACPRDLGLIEPVLRQFECRLLREMGVAPDFAPGLVRQAPLQRYEVRPHEGVHPLQAGHPAAAALGTEGAGEALGPTVVQGQTLIALARYDESLSAFSSALEEPSLAAEAKRMLRALIRHHLGGADLLSREAVRALHLMRSGA